MMQPNTLRGFFGANLQDHSAFGCNSMSFRFGKASFSCFCTNFRGAACAASFLIPLLRRLLVLVKTGAVSPVILLPVLAIVEIRVPHLPIRAKEPLPV